MRRPLIVSFSPMAPYDATKDHERLFRQGCIHALQGAVKPTSYWHELIASHTLDKILVIDSFSIIAPKWIDVYPIVEHVIQRGWRFISVKEKIDIQAVGKGHFCPVMNAMFHVYMMESDRKREKVNQIATARAKESFFGKSGMRVNPDKALLDKIKEDEKVMKVTDLCKKHKISRTAFYKWKKKGFM